MVLALLPFLVYLLMVFRTGELPSFVPAVTDVLGKFGGFFTPILTSLLSDLVDLSDASGIVFFSWLVGYYVVLLLVYLVFGLFTFLITMFMDKVDSIKGR